MKNADEQVKRLLELVPQVRDRTGLNVAVSAGILTAERLALTIPLAVMAMLLTVVLALAVWANSGFAPVTAANYPAPAAAGPTDGDWLHFGNDQGGRHFSALTVIDPVNVGKLQVAWTAPLGPMPMKPVGQIDAILAG